MNILITGGSGFIGKALTNKLTINHQEVKWLTRSKNSKDSAHFYWNPKSQEIEDESIEWADTIIHLAGASVAGKRWSEKYKKEIYDSRIDSSKLLVNAINKSKKPPKKLISASATGYYGSFDGAHAPFTELDSFGEDFLAKVTKDWEAEIFKTPSSTEVSAIRIGFVLANEGGALEQLVTPIKLGLGAPIGSGQQILSWIHLEDLLSIFEKMIAENSLGKIVNGVAPEFVSNKEMTKQISQQLKRPLFLPNVPKFALKLLLGEFASFACRGTAVSAQKLLNSNFQFKYPTLKEALKDLLR